MGEKWSPPAGILLHDGATLGKSLAGQSWSIEVWAETNEIDTRRRHHPANRPFGERTMEGLTTSMIETVEGFENEASSLACGVFNACPAMYRERPNSSPLNVAWNEATELTTRAMNALEALGDHLRKEAGITTPGPTAEFFDESADSPADTEIGPDGNGSAIKG